ncbi:MAG TPA: alpha/beta fold hydrolase [Dehalococcoidia bacterium]|jgi:class 3 adenylate cyclase/pimeloyl-ACP methyl ester carboxylesterase|nr:alpha/beta fold hydrolase [Dehalococcoidia bacterium]
MPHSVQYATTTDGVSIAYWSIGEGIPIVIPPIIVTSHLEVELQIPSRRATYEGLARGAQVVRYDCRGMGMSQRDAIDFSMEAAERDLNAVVDRLGLEKFALLRLPSAGDICFAYAASNPSRVSHLIVWEGHTVQDDLDSPRREQIEAIEPVMQKDWDLYVRIRARIIAGWDGSNAPIIESILRETHSPQSAHAMNAALMAMDPTPYLKAIEAPTLVMYRGGVRPREDNARKFASQISNSQLVLVREPSIGPYPNETAISEMLSFINPERRAMETFFYEHDHDHEHDSALRVILFTDVEKHTAMMQRLGDERGRALLRELEIITREALASYGGSEVKTMGDSFMASFGSATRALECAIAIQKAFAERNATADEPLRVRCGLSAGEPIAEDDDLFGSSVILAARIADQAKGGEIILANVVRELAAGKGFLFSDRGEMALRGFEDPVRLYELKWTSE